MTNNEAEDQSPVSPGHQHWYIDRDNIRQGPFSTRDIQNFVMEGTLRLEDQIINAFSGQVQEASYVFLPINEVLPLENDKSGSTGWQPPPRPVESQALSPQYTIHSQTREVDYFALVAHTKKRKLSLGASPESKKKKSKSQEHTAGAAHTKRASRRLSEKLENSTRSIRVHATGFWNVLQKSPHHLMYKAAAVAFIGTGVFGIVKTTSSTGHRQPAAASTPQPVKLESPLSKDLKATAKSKAGTHGAMPSASEQAIGRGQNPVIRDIGQDSTLRGQTSPTAPEEAPAPEVTPSTAAAPTTPPNGSTEQSPSAEAAAVGAASASPAAGDQAVSADTNSPPSPPAQAQSEEPAQHFDPSTFEAVNTPVTPPELPASETGGEPSAGNRAPAAPEGPVAEVQTAPPTDSNPEGSQESSPTP